MSETSRDADDLATRPREMCYRCLKARVVCVCASVGVVDNRVGVTVFQHPREYRHSIGTARFLRLGLRRCRVIVPWADGSGTFRREVSVPRDAALLYPGVGARDLATIEPSDRPSHLVVLDGTWHHAKCLRRDNTWLHALPMVSLDPAEPSRYRIRPAPAAHCLSTVESVVAALAVLEPDTIGLDGLVAAFDRMIDEQIRCANGGKAKRHSHPRANAEPHPRASAEPRPRRPEGADVGPVASSGANG